jgi:hypothetical protein
MIRQLSTWLVVALVGVFIAGCGSSSSSTSSSQSSAATATTSSTPAAGGTTSTSGTTTTPSVPTSVPTTAAGVAQAVAACKSIIQSEPTLSSSLKAKVEGICNKAANGDLAGARTAAKEVCAEVINASPIPAAAKAQALAACRRS